MLPILSSVSLITENLSILLTFPAFIRRGIFHSKPATNLRIEFPDVFFCRAQGIDWYAKISQAVADFSRNQNESSKFCKPPLRSTSKSQNPKRARWGLKNGFCWKPDELEKKCKHCQEAFSLFRRKHHCRNCSDVSSCLQVTSGAGRGGKQGTPPPPEIEKNCCRKRILFPKALFLATTFPKIDKNSIFLMNF